MNAFHKPSAGGGQMLSALIFLALSCLLLVGADILCWQLKEESKVVLAEKAAVELSLLPESLTRGGAQFVLKNQSEVTVMYGETYSLEEYAYGKWYPVEAKGDAYFILIGYFLKPGEKRTLVVNWSHFWGSLPDGQYRLVKEFTVTTPIPGDRFYTNFSKTAEFAFP